MGKRDNGSRDRGTGSYIPEKIVENRELEQMVETTEVWIRERTGICRRHIAEKETVVDMGVQAAMQALEHSGISAKEIDLLIVSTLSAETVMPSVLSDSGTYRSGTGSLL